MGTHWTKRPTIKPKFSDGLAWCSCSTSTTGERIGECPMWALAGRAGDRETWWCGIGNGVQSGGMGGSVCTPYFREMLYAQTILADLLAMAKKGATGE